MTKSTIQYALGIDVGGTNIKYGLVTSEGNIVQTGSVPTPQNDPKAAALLPLLTQLVENFKNDKPIAVGIAIPGIVSQEGVAEFSSSLGFRDLPLGDMLRSSLTIPNVIVHDVTSSSKAEYLLGQASNVENVVVIQIGTGIAATLILDGKVYRPHSAMGEFGHIPTKYDRLCPCGGRSCLEATASGGALRRNYKALTGEDKTAEEIFNLAEENNQPAVILYNEFIDALSSGIQTLAALLGPEKIILSGGVSAESALLSDLKASLNPKLSFHLKPELVVSKANNDMGAIGAGLSAWEIVSS
jgi:glucokinase